MADINSIAQRRAAMMTFSGQPTKYKKMQNPLTPGQAATGQSAMFEPTRADDAQKASTPSPNIAGMATGPAAPEKTQAMSDAANIGLNPQAQQTPQQPTAQTGPLMAMQSAAKKLGKTSTPGLDISSAATPQMPQPASQTMATPQANVAPQTTENAPTSMATPYATTASSAVTTGELPPGWTQEEWDLYQKFLNGEGLSEQEKAWLQDKLGRTKTDTLEQLNRAQGASGGNSALEVLGGAEAERTYQSGLADIASQDYARKLQQMQMAAQLASQVGNRAQNISTTWDDAVKYFGDAGYVLNSDGTLTGADGSKVDYNSLTPEQKQAYQTFMTESGMDNPYSDNRTQDEIKREQQAIKDAQILDAFKQQFGEPSMSKSGFYKDRNTGKYVSYDQLPPEYQAIVKAQMQGTEPDLFQYVYSKLIEKDPLLQAGGGDTLRNPGYAALVNSVVNFIKANNRPPTTAELAMFYDEAGVGKPGNIADAGNPQITFEEVTLPNGTVVKIPGEPKYPDAFDL